MKAAIVTVRVPSTQTTLHVDVEHFKLRLLQDCLSQALADTWLARAEAIEESKPRPGDFNGRATEAELEVRSAELSKVVLACRRHAALIRAGVI